MFDKSGNMQYAVQHITGVNEDAWCREKEAKQAGFKFGKKIHARDKIAEYKRKRDLKQNSKILPVIKRLVEPQGASIHHGAKMMHKHLREPSDPL